MKTLIAYFSHAGENYFSDGIKYVEVGNAEIIAKKLNQLISADIFKIDTIKKYSDNYRTCCDEAKLEQQKNELPQLIEYLPSIDQYDKIYLVYPCWWGTMPQAVFTFLNHYNFANKQIYPICTHEGSGMGRSEKDIMSTCPTAKVNKGLAIVGSFANECDNKLKEYLK